MKLILHAFPFQDLAPSQDSSGICVRDDLKYDGIDIELIKDDGLFIFPHEYSFDKISKCLI